MRKIESISFPRSGRHLLVNCLDAYFGENFHYCECYGHCRQVPCPDLCTTFQKNHDLQLDLLPVNGYGHLVQYRHPLEAIVSYYELCLRLGLTHEVADDNEVQWLQFLSRKMHYWQGFARKWILGNPVDDRYLLSYDHLVGNTRQALEEVVGYVSPGEDIDTASIERIVGELDNKPLRDIRQFRFYDKVIFDQAENAVAKELQALQIPRQIC